MEIGEKELELSNKFYQITEQVPVKVYDEGDYLYFLVEDKDKALSRLKLLETAFKKRIIIYQDSDDLEQFLKNFFNNVKIHHYEVEQIGKEKHLLLFVDGKDAKKLYGKGKSRFNVAKKILKEKFNMDLHVRKVPSLG
ncbi:MAG: hypothetical protein GXN92_00995 [Candidatus Micrarchaeota archaeon]|nr:hypothetical protein [Candidatus Micrarchaeota archaeon]